VINNSLARALLLAGRYDDALAQARRTLDIDPGFGGAYLTLGETYVRLGRHADAISALERAVTLMSDLSRPLAWLGHAYGAASEPEKARQALDRLEARSWQTPVSPYDIALVHTGLGDSERAFDWLERASDARASDLIQLKVDRRFDSLRSDPRFADLLRRVGVDPRT
jgi:tetratricopeptide (TPR) repeat protein